MIEFPTIEELERKYPRWVRVGKLGRVRLKGPAMAELRHFVFVRDGGRCVLCGQGVIEESGLWASMHLMHKTSKGAGGSDTPENTECGCLKCHMGSHNCGGKPLRSAAQFASIVTLEASSHGG